MSGTTIREWSAGTEIAFERAVSLHAHTSCSKEDLGFIPAWSESVPVVGRLLQREMANYYRRHGSPLDFERVYWRPHASGARCSISACTT